MIPFPGLLLIGAAHRDAGKTTFGCEVLRRLAGAHRIAAVKVTCVAEREGLCPRGGEGCGACGSLTGPWCLTQEERPDLPKDTSRLLRAGAAQVLWLRARPESLAAGLAAVRERVGPGLVLCESNSARLVVEPDLFVVARRTDDPFVKPSCAAVLPLADRVAAFDGRGWTFPPEDVAVAPGPRWVARPAATAAILAGGASRRMGEDKSLADAGGRPLIARVAAQLAYFPELLIGADDPAKYAFLGLPVVPDPAPGLGPLAGILACVARARHDRCFVTACDIPDIDPRFALDLVAAAEDCDAVVPRLPDGRLEPLLAVYRKTVVPVAVEVLRGGPQRITKLLERIAVRHVPFAPPPWYRNLNLPGELSAWRERNGLIDRPPGV